ncbi:MAG: family 16 glycosylhydrolase [Verrucomicrobia bacterium]|nr:family 16 glycosylhydrolase [Verrucomicrobiota bacterium]MCH8528030.1 family 16 glycosylhydrolase [Kiritimatiellia bacterium]
MNPSFISFRFLSALVFFVLLPLAGQNITLELAREMRVDVEVVEEALLRAFQHAGSEQVRRDVGVAGTANRRVGQHLDGIIGEFKAVEAAERAKELFDGGMRYPPAARVRIESFEVPVGTTEVHVPVTLDKASPNTVIAYVRVLNGDGGRADPDQTRAVFFRPGDPLIQTVTFRVRDMREGHNVRAVQPTVPDGGIRDGGGIRITAQQGAVNEPVEGGRDPLRFAPLGELVYAVTGDTIKFDDRGGPDTFSTALSHGRTQDANQETGYYGTVEMGGFVRTPEGLKLSTRRLDEPVRHGSPAREYPFLAAMLSGHRTTDTHFKYGSVEWVVRMPNRRYAWPALWLLPTRGWPPEIDVYEGFGYNNDWDFSANLATNLHGGRNLRRAFTRSAMHMKMHFFGLPNTLDSAFHVHAVTVDPEWITMFVDGVETMRYANPFRGETWYPLTNVAVKAGMESAYDKGSGAMTLKSLKVWRSE